MNLLCERLGYELEWRQCSSHKKLSHINSSWELDLMNWSLDTEDPADNCIWQYQRYIR